MGVGNYIVFDMETEAIQPRPDYPPKPVSFAVKFPNRPTKFYAWGHPIGNNCSFEEAQTVLRHMLGRELPIVCFNTKFDMAVLEEGMGLSIPDACHIHDAMLLAHLSNPYEPTFALKPLAEKHLNLPPTERDAVREWLVENGVCKASDKNWGAYISLAPGDLVGPYAIGDVDRTARLFDKLYLDIERRNMVEAYDRERFLIPILHENEKRGVRVDLPLLESDFELYTEAMAKVEGWLRERLGVPDLNLDADQQMAKALRDNGIVKLFAQTKTGKDSVSKATLTKDKFTDEQVFLALGYRNRLQTCLSTFIGPWLTTAQKCGRIYTSWRQLGAVTGRMSSTPNFQNMAKNWYDKPDGYAHPAFIDLPELPLLRKYILPEKGHVLIAADYAGQEVRVAAHFEDGALMQAYNDNPKLDPHDFVRGVIKELTGQNYERRICKVALFSTLYGAGARKLSEQLDCSQSEAAQIRQALFLALPGIKDVDAELKQRAKCGVPFRTLGGREYYCEPPKMIDGRHVAFEYKCLNTVIQGSSADMTKAAMIRYDALKKHGTLLLTVHDEVVLSVPAEHAATEASILIDAMQNAMTMDVPIIAEVKAGENFASMKGMS
jgi:DNA polymerase-1